MSRRDELALGRVADALDVPGAVHRLDRTGPAIYQLEPVWATAILCPACEFVTLLPTLPRVLALIHRCPACRAPIRLEPPADVLAAAPPSSLLRAH